ncbi:hypothetical protein [Aeoliella mucimassa]|uniref:Outer membrane protein beta-barrel domain-containing protein n=1 Tax=Aeoliella mucimassa TaxID=2527972 RepID=A0A518ALJ7_9BACT|nr:hypothetical protein [Aeoliella mucimassa]QDU55564.1 hypothetical protein Pan181_17560 [Aeoliella mucimassa]
MRPRLLKRCLVMSCLVMVALHAMLMLPTAIAGELGQLRSSAADSGSSSSSSASSGSSSSRGDSGYSDPFDDSDSFIFQAILYTLAVPYYPPYSLFDDPDAERFTGYQPTFEPGTFKDTDWFCRSTNFICSARAQVEYGTNFNDMQTIGNRLQIDLARIRSTIDLSYDNYFEKLPNGDTDHLAVGNANWVLRFAQNPRTVWRSGIGVNWMNGDQNDVGFNFTYGFDLLPVEPWVWSNDLDLGRLGDAGLFRFRTTVGQQFRLGEIYTGFEYLDAGDAQIPTMLFGARYWW